MNELDELIEEKDIGELKKKGKKFKFPIKRTLLGVLCTTLIWSAIPNIEYNIARIQANNNKYITSVLEDTNLSKEQQIAQIYKTALMENKNIPDDIKELLIASFTSEVINHAGIFFTEDTIRNMYAVAKTEKISQMSEFAKEHGWWSGDGINEGATTFFGKSDSSYYSENNIINILGFIIGYENLLETYTNSDLSVLKKMLYQYISPQEANELIHKIDLNVFQRIS